VVRVLLLLAISIVSVTGCTFHGALGPQLYEAPAPQGKIPLKVSLVVAEPFRSQRLVFTTLNVREIALNPGLAESIRAALSGLFREVTVTDNAGRAGNADLLVVPSAEVQRFRPVALALTFSEPTTRKVVGTYDAATTVNWADPPEAGMAAFLTGFSLFTLSPLTLNWEASASGNNAIVRAQEGMARNLDVLASKIRSDQTRLAAAAATAALSDAAKACDQSDDVAARIRGCSEIIAKGQGRPEFLAIVYDHRGAAYLRQRDFDRAMADLEQAIRLDGKSINAHYHRGRVWESRRQYERAAQDYDRVVALIQASLAVKPDARLRDSATSIGARAREMELRRGMEQRWVEYLKTIQASQDYENWSAPPHDLYRQGKR
jgi:hypothetical protein